MSIINNFSPAVSFLNIGKDAELVCPNPLFKQTDYAHLAGFVRTAPSHQVQGECILTLCLNRLIMLTWLGLLEQLHPIKYKVSVS